MRRNLKDMLFESEPGKKQPIQAPAPAAKVEPLPATLIPNTDRDLPPSNANAAYQKLAARIDFDSTDVGKTLAKYLAPLQSLGIDESSKYKAAVAQAAAQEGLSVAGILSTFDDLKRNLQVESASFENSMSDFSNTQIATKTKDRDALEQQIQQLQSKSGQLTAEINNAKIKVDQARSDFKDAVSHLSQKLDSQKARYADLLGKGKQ